MEINEAESWHIIGYEHEINNRLQEAIVCYKKALDLNPNMVGTLNNIGSCYIALGKFQEAKEKYTKAVSLNPKFAMAYRNVSQMVKVTTSDEIFGYLKEEIDKEHSERDQADLHFAYGHILMNSGLKDEGFNHIMKANELFHPYAFYDEQLHLNVVENIKKHFTKELFETNRNRTINTAKPIFIIGMPRSGSTLIEQVLASHPDIHAAGESVAFKKTLEISGTVGLPNGSGIIDYDGALTDITNDQLVGLYQEYIRQLGITQLPRITDKYLLNFIYLGFIHLAMPQAKIIHIKRSPIETCLSIYSRWFRDVPFGYNLGELGRYYRSYNDLMKHWNNVITEGAMINVNYEDVVNDVEANARMILNHCNLPWDDNCLKFYENERPVMTASAAQVRKPIYKNSLELWKPNAKLLQPLLDELQLIS
jgi:tetratricopeptide (TPR) repeat protein